MTDPDQFRPLQQAAREELARQIDAGAGDAARLVAGSGWSWNLAFVLVRAIGGEGANAAALRHEGIPAQAAYAIAAAIKAVHAARDAAARVVPVPEKPVVMASSGALRGAAKPKAWRGKRGDYFFRGVI